MPQPAPLASASCLAFILLAAAPRLASAVSIVTGAPAGPDTYVEDAVQAIGYRWTPPPGLHGRFSVTVEVDLDKRGRVTACRPMSSSGMEAFDVAACGAARIAGPFGPTPGGHPMTLRCAFTRDTGEGAAGRDADEVLHERVLRAQRRATARRALDASFDEESAHRRAVEAAEELGRDATYDFVPGQDIPGAQQIMRRPVRSPARGAAAAPADKEAQARDDVKPGPVISRWPPHPAEKEEALVITPSTDKDSVVEKKNALAKKRARSEKGRKDAPAAKPAMSAKDDGSGDAASPAKGSEDTARGAPAAER